MQRFILLAWLTIIALLISACGGDAPDLAFDGLASPTETSEPGMIPEASSAEDPDVSRELTESSTGTSTVGAPTTLGTSSTTLPTTTTRPPTTTSTLPSISFDGRTYECDEGVLGAWTCESSFETVYCNGLSGPDRCSAIWYPDDLDHLRLVEFQGIGYACEQYGSACVRYDGGPPPAYVVHADLWCDGSTCQEYDPDQYFEISFQVRTYLCEQTLLGFQKYDCNEWYGGAQPLFGFEPDLYCSGSEFFPECSTLWYPSELSSYTMFDDYTGTYLCEPAYTTRYGDYDCGSYSGGNPSYVYSLPLKCSTQYGGIECNREDYPSFLSDVYFTTIDWGQYACRNTWGGSECFRYSYGSVESAMFGIPDYYCNHSGYCDPLGYP